MDAPEKIYLQVCGDCSQTDCDNCKFSDLEDNVTWCKDRIFNKDIEYTRTDAFIEKACQYIRSHSALLDSDGNDCQPEWLEKFKKAMKGE